MSTTDVVIAAGGMIGAACARSATRRGLKVVVCDQGPLPGAATPASAGMLAAQIEPDDDAMLSLAVRARDLYDPLATELRDATGIPRQWIQKIRRAMATLVPRFNTWRMVEEYARKYYTTP